MVTVNLTPWLLWWKLPLLIRLNNRTTFYHFKCPAYGTMRTLMPYIMWNELIAKLTFSDAPWPPERWTNLPSKCTSWCRDNSSVRRSANGLYEGRSWTSVTNKNKSLNYTKYLLPNCHQMITVTFSKKIKILYKKSRKACDGCTELLHLSCYRLKIKHQQLLKSSESSSSRRLS